MPKAFVDLVLRALDTRKHPDLVGRLRQSDQAVVADSPGASVARVVAGSETWGVAAKRTGLQAD